MRPSNVKNKLEKESPKGQTNWKRIRSMTEAQIHAAIAKDPDILPTDAEFWDKAKLVIPHFTKTQ
jgi:hypothetical protein